MAAVPRGALVVFDGGFLHSAHSAQLTTADTWFLTRPAARMASRGERVLVGTADRRDLLVRVGAQPEPRGACPLRPIEVRRPDGW